MCSRTRLDGILSASVRRDSANSPRMVEMIRGSQFALARPGRLAARNRRRGFNVVDVHALHRELEVPVLVVARRRRNHASIKRALFGSRGDVFTPRGRRGRAVASVHHRER